MKFVADPFIWEAARATSAAAPLHFKKYTNKYIDGGISANNPTSETLGEIIEMN
jgi:patatin-like phospholipase/acyl hydrolase